MPKKPAAPITAIGTPCARTWSADWIAAINATETQLNRRICGARLPDGTPCTNESDHHSGRCRYHGGFDLTGAPKGNRNGVIHGLYSRRLRTCSQTCPHWHSCPCANANHDTSDRSDQTDPSYSPSTPSTPSTSSISSSVSSSVSVGASPCSSAPLCPYQLTEYNTVLTDALAVVESQPYPNPLGTHAAHNVALLQVLINSAAIPLTNSGVSPANDAEPPGPVSPESIDANSRAILAFLRLMRELRAEMKVLYAPRYTPLPRQKSIGAAPALEGVVRHAQRAKHDTGLDPDSLAKAQLHPETESLHAKAYLRQSIDAAAQGHDVEMAEAFDNAIYLDERLAKTEHDHVAASYRPAKHSVSEELANHILGNLHLPPLPGMTDNSEVALLQHEYEALQRHNDYLENYLKDLKAGKIPPEAFPKNSHIRAFAESVCASQSTSADTERSETGELSQCHP